MQEKRSHQRIRTYLGGQIVYQHRCCSVDCLVRNLSEQGARLALSGSAMFPAEIDLVIPYKGGSRRAQLVWRTETELGVRFLNQVADAALSIDAMKKVGALKTRNAALTRRVRELTEASV